MGRTGEVLFTASEDHRVLRFDCDAKAGNAMYRSELTSFADPVNSVSVCPVTGRVASGGTVQNAQNLDTFEIETLKPRVILNPPVSWSRQATASRSASSTRRTSKTQW